ncbi:hypothetical protein NBM05_03900 [Rothia sp. AR01]|uniref:Holin n=1 Tax=Rothia santali TaxID=2949643 RepID=A0A9X2HGB0_9MICC|nr:hypothetical protein [Rothia santali]MCP3425191.1 hypothetical protein [Rothia santali]
MNLLNEIIPDQYRKPVYAAFAVIGAVLGTIQVIYGGAGPEWVDAALNAYAYVGTALGFTAAANVLNGKPTPPVTQVDEDLPMIESDYEADNREPEVAETGATVPDAPLTDEPVGSDELENLTVAAPYDGRHTA